ncbi:hypothetical protein EDM56_25710 [Brevibacillus fluminis]|uniref:Uncharacterized protein n=1 Tax=Brevibacillus fluminis TaxID=511487 RepID=A0A3M8D1Q6_9BACL|nr:hypothetical protein [Brevibacillus fluminis]RNB81125.1 hypothetical protein EDM56_25710 [Brevibacillus fluminis]
MWRKLLYMYLILLGCILIYAESLPQIPGVHIQATIGPITEEEYRLVQGKQLNRADLQKLLVRLKLSDSKSMTERTLKLPDLSAPLKNLSNSRVLQQFAAERNLPGVEEEATAEQFVIFDARGLDDEAIRELYSDSVGYLIYHDRDGKQSSDTFVISSIMQRVKSTMAQ